MGVPHQNEYRLGNGYSADIFIGSRDVDSFLQGMGIEKKGSGKGRGRGRPAKGDSGEGDREGEGEKDKGVVLEIDGPSHFETYMLQVSMRY